MYSCLPRRQHRGGVPDAVVIAVPEMAAARGSS